MRSALYARYSTDRQTESSIKDQFRVCGERCAKDGLVVVARFEDQGISGAATGNRPGFLEMVEAVNAGCFDVLVVMDLTRLSRSQGDLSKFIDRLTSRGVRVIGVQDGYDSSRKGHKLQAGLSGIIGEAFREMCSEKTYTALESRAMQGKPTGGKCYGYGDGEADVVRQIFVWYADGRSPKWIAAELNSMGVPSPGSVWNRTERRRRGWVLSAVNGDRRRGLGILNNELYIGRDIWNHSHWIKDPDSGKRRQVQRPESQWIVRNDESKRIVPQELWDQVKDRQRRLDVALAANTAAGKRSSGGHNPTYLFSGLMRCEQCGSSFVMKDKHSYACSGFVSGHACSNSYRVRRDLLEDRLLTTIRDSLLSDSAIKEFTAKIRGRLQTRPANPHSKRRIELQAEIENMIDAIGQGMISPALRQRLQEAESDLSRLTEPAPVVGIEAALQRLPEAVNRYRAMVADLGNAPIDRGRTREIVRGLLGDIRIAPRDGYLVAKMGLAIQPLSGSSIRGSGGRI